MFYDVILAAKQYSAKSIAISIGCSAAVLIPVWIIANNLGYIPDITLIMSLIFAGSYLILAMLQLWKKHRKKILGIALALCLIEVFVSAFYTFRYLGHDVSEEASRDSIHVLAERHPDITAPFTATEIIGDAADDMAESTDIESISIFSSFMTRDHIDTFHRWNLLVSSNYTYYLGGNILSDMMLHIKYHISNSYVDNSWSHYEVIDSVNNLTLHENPYFLPLGVYFSDTQAMNEWNTSTIDHYTDENGNDTFMYQNAFSHALGFGDIYTELDFEENTSNITEENREETTYIDADFSTASIGTTSTVPVTVHLGKDVEGDVFISHQNIIVYLGTKEKGSDEEFAYSITLPEEDTTAYIRLATVDYDELNKLHSKLAQYVMTDIDTSLSTITGKITAPEDGIIYLSLPEMKGWHCYVDGEAVDHIRYLDGVGIKVSAGDHSLRITYTAQGMWLGIAISAVTLIILIAVAIIINHRKQRVK